MADRRFEIPSLAYINAQVLQNAHYSGQLSTSYKLVEQNYKLPVNSFNIMNPAYMLSLLYCLILVPKELWAKDKIADSIAKLDTKHTLDLFSVKTKSPQFHTTPMLALLRHLRNALAHVRFSVDESSDTITFWDQETDKSTRHFEASISMNNLEIFLSHFGAELANLRTRP
jgi:cytochrome c biogenesis factor